MKARGRSPARTLRGEIPSRPAAVDALCLELRAFLGRHELTDVAFPVELAARECLNNAVLHGNQRNATKRVRLELRIGRTWIRLQVTDQGRGFNWRRARAAAPSAGTIPHGRGMAICRQYSQRVAFNQRGNRITLWLRKTTTEQ